MKITIIFKSSLALRNGVMHFIQGVYIFNTLHMIIIIMYNVYNI